MNKVVIPGGKKKRNGCLTFMLAVIISLVLCMISYWYLNKTTPPETAKPEPKDYGPEELFPSMPPRTGKVLLKTKAEYEDGVITITGVATNDNDTAIYSPIIVLEIYADDVKIDEQTTWPAGWYAKDVRPGEKAAFEFYSIPPNGFDEVQWRVYCQNYLSEMIEEK
jgi:hypothetical protein